MPTTLLEAEVSSRPDVSAELHTRLGGVPLDRILRHPAPGTATIADAEIEHPDFKYCELVHGTLVAKAMGYPQSSLGARLIRLLDTFVDLHNLGIVGGEQGLVRSSKGNIRIPDVSFVPWTRLPGGTEPTDLVLKYPPTLVVEVLSPSNTAEEIRLKLIELFAVGVELAWVIDPDAKTARVYRSPKRFVELDETGTLDGEDVLPGFSVSLEYLFRPRRQS